MKTELFEKLYSLRVKKEKELEYSNHILNKRIKVNLKQNNGVVCKDTKWWYKERDKQLIKMSKLSMEINKLKKEILS